MGNSGVKNDPVAVSELKDISEALGRHDGCQEEKDVQPRSAFPAGLDGPKKLLSDPTALSQG